MSAVRSTSRRERISVPLALWLSLTALLLQEAASFSPHDLAAPQGRRPRRWCAYRHRQQQQRRRRVAVLTGWVERNGEWEWEEDDASYVAPPVITLPEQQQDDDESSSSSSATPKLPAGKYRPKQSLGQNYLKDPNTVAKILRAFDKDVQYNSNSNNNDDDDDDNPPPIIVELGPGAGALTDRLVEQYDQLHCIEIDERSVQLLRDKHCETTALTVQHADVLQVDYGELARQLSPTTSKATTPLTVIGNLPYYITSQILFALADAAHHGAVRSATVTVQWEVGQRLVAATSTKDYGILSVVFQLYCDPVRCHFKIPPTVFYPQPKVDSALLGLHFVPPDVLRRRRLAGVAPRDLRRVVTATFQQRRKTVRNSLKKLLTSMPHNLDRDQVQAILRSPPLPLPAAVREAAIAGDAFAQRQALPADWASKRPEELVPGQFVELTRLVLGANMETDDDDGDGDDDVDGNDHAAALGHKVWRKLKHGKNNYSS